MKPFSKHEHGVGFPIGLAYSGTKFADMPRDIGRDKPTVNCGGLDGMNVEMFPIHLGYAFPSPLRPQGQCSRMRIPDRLAYNRFDFPARVPVHIIEKQARHFICDPRVQGISNICGQH